MSGNNKPIVKTIKRITTWFKRIATWSKPIAIWSLVSLFLQLAVLAYLNYFYLPNKNKVDIVEVKPRETVGSRRARIPVNAENIRVSYDGRYAAYLYQEELCIIETKESRIIKSIPARDRILSFYMWLPDRNILIYSMDYWGKKRSVTEVFTYDADGDILRNYPPLEIAGVESMVMDIALSPLTNIVYLKVGNASKASLYKFDIMDNLSFIMDVEPSARISKALYSDILLIQNTDLSIFTWNGSSLCPMEIPGEGRMVLLGLDGEDNVYLGEVKQEGKVFRIFSGPLGQDGVKDWEETELLPRAGTERIIISGQGDIYILEENENSIKSLFQKDRHTIYNFTKKIRRVYEGDFIEITAGHIVSRKGRYLLIDELI